MCDQQAKIGKLHDRRRRRVWLIATIVPLVAIVALILWATCSWRDSRSADERLAEIEGARAIPDSENAAMIYNQLLQDPNASSPLDYVPESLDPQIVNRGIREPWLSEDQSKLAAWLKEHQFLIDRLLEVSRFEKCRFPISIDVVLTSQVDRAAPMRQWGFLLSMAANNDIAEGRVDAAMAKWQAILRMADHMRQQPTLIDHIIANGIEELAPPSLAGFVATGDVTESRLREIEAMYLPMKDGWAQHLKEIQLIEGLRSRKLTEQFSALDRLRYHLVSFQMRRAVNPATGWTFNQSPSDMTGHKYRRCIATARGVRILVTLRRYKNANGRWPESLDEIKASLSEEVLTDPFNKGSFIYKPVGDTFRLYSRGKNGIDENGKWESDAWESGVNDDWLIWPPRRRDPGAQQEDADK